MTRRIKGRISMAKERLSKLQSAILTLLSDNRYWHYSELKIATAKALNKWILYKWVNSCGDHMEKWDFDGLDSFPVAFSRSIGGLFRKGLASAFKLLPYSRGYYESTAYHGRTGSSKVKITEKGLNVKLSQFNIKK